MLDCNSSSTWLGNNLHVQFKSSTYFNSFMTYLNFFSCSCPCLSLFSSNSRFSSAIRTVCQGGRRARAVSPGCGTALRASFIKLSGLRGSLFSFFLPYGCGNLQAMIHTFEKPTADKIKLTQSKVFCEVTLRFSYLAIHKTHLYSIIGSFRFPLGSPSF